MVHDRLSRILVSLLPLLACCIGGTPVRTSCEWETFQRLSLEKKEDVLRECSPSRQVELYLRWSFATVPANYDLVDAVASGGRNVVPFIVYRIERNEGIRDELVKPELLYVLVRMQDRGYWEVAKDELLMRRLETAVAMMSEPELKESAEQSLASLRSARR